MIVYSAGFTTSGATEKVNGLILAIAGESERRFRRVSIASPGGNFNRSTPCAGPFTLLCTVHVNANDFDPMGTAPADGDTVTEIAGPTSSGFGSHADPRNRSLVCTTCCDFERHATIATCARTASG